MQIFTFFQQPRWRKQKLFHSPRFSQKFRLPPVSFITTRGRPRPAKRRRRDTHNEGPGERRKNADPRHPVIRPQTPVKYFYALAPHTAPKCFSVNLTLSRAPKIRKSILFWAKERKRETHFSHLRACTHCPLIMMPAASAVPRTRIRADHGETRDSAWSETRRVASGVKARRKF